MNTIIKENHGTRVAVTPAYFWEPMHTCPLGCKVQLKTLHGVAVYGTVTHSTRGQWAEWAPMPTTRKAVSYTHLTLPTNREV